MANRTKKQVVQKVEIMTPANYMAIAWAVLALGFFPAFYTDYYFNILETKFISYSTITGMLFAGLLVWGIASGSIKDYFANAKATFAGEDGKWVRSWFKGTFSFVDKCMMVFILVSVISTLCAYPYISQAFVGNEGRYTGLFLLLLYVGAYFCISRFFRYRQYVITVFLWIGIFICLFGITDYFNMDLLRFRELMKEEQYRMFSSTIGNINTYTTYVGFVLAFSGAMFNTSSEWIGRRIFYYICMVISFVAIIMGQSDNGYLTLLAFFGFLPLATFNTRRGLRRYVLTLATFLSCIEYVRWVNVAYYRSVSGLDGLFRVIAKLKYLNVITILVWITAVALYIYDYKKGLVDGKLPKAFHKAWLGLDIAAIAGLVIILILANTSMRDAAVWGSLKSYLVFSDKWGTQRGYVWRACMQTYAKLPILHKIFGTGPDTFGIYMMNYCYQEMSSITHQIYDSAHNEYLQYLFTLGPVGLLAYLGAIGGSIYIMIKKAASSEHGAILISAAFLILCYAIQATVNINLPISTPIMWAWLSIAGALARQE